MRTILYARVSTADQTIEHQHAMAVAAGFAIDEVVAEHGVSGILTKLAERSGGARLLQAPRWGRACRPLGRPPRAQLR